MVETEAKMKANIEKKLNPKRLTSQATADMVVMPVQKANSTIFSSIAIDKKNKISHWNQIGWTDPTQPNP